MTREEAIQILRTQYPHDAVIKEALGLLIPELRESEDERIRKEIINYLDFAESHNLLRAADYEKKKGWLAYLEKQKEQKTTFNIKQFGLNDFEEELFLLLRGMKYLNISDEEIAHNVKNQIAPNLSELMQKEQKPRWEINNPYTTKWTKEMIDEKFEKLVEPKPTEWSEEDERMRNQLIYDVEHHKKEGLISAKKNKATKALYNGIEKCYDEKIAWLKSLRPQSHWKPSEEQESVAERFARIVRANLSKIDKEVQQEFEHLYFEITGNKMYGGYHD